MRKIEELHFKLFLLFLIIMPIWSYTRWVSMGITLGLVILDIIYFFHKDHKKRRIDIIDCMFILLPLYYLLPYIFGLNVNNLIDNLFYIFMEFGLSLTLITIRRYWDKEKKEKILVSMITMSVIYFFLSFIYQAFPKGLTPIGITSYFGDTYFNSIDRFYGSLDYCNISALYFIICFFIALFKIKDDENNKYIYYLMTFIDMLGFLITYSKMVSFDFIIVSIVLIIYLIVRKKKELLNNYIVVLISLVMPIMIAVKASRMFLINLNLFIFIFIIILCFLLYIAIIKLIEFIYSKLRLGICLLLVGEILVIIYFMLNPIIVPLKINDVMRSNDYIIYDFILEPEKEYDIELDVKVNNKSNVDILLCGLYVGENLVPKEDILARFNEDDKIKYELNSKDMYEYYYIKLDNINVNTDLVIENISIDGEKQVYNSLVVPYQFIHQLDLMKYDVESVSSRLTYYKDSLKMLKYYGYVLGHGRNSFAELKEYYYTNYNETDPHSMLFQLWLDTGLYGVIYILMMIIIGIRDMFKYRLYDGKIIYFVLFSLCMIVMPFDLIYSNFYMKLLLMLFFIMLDDDSKNIKIKS